MLGDNVVPWWFRQIIDGSLIYFKDSILMSRILCLIFTFPLQWLSFLTTKNYISPSNTINTETAMVLWYLSVFRLHGEVHQASSTKSPMSPHQPFVFRGQGFYFVIKFPIWRSNYVWSLSYKFLKSNSFELESRSSWRFLDIVAIWIWSTTHRSQFVYIYIYIYTHTHTNTNLSIRCS